MRRAPGGLMLQACIAVLCLSGAARAGSAPDAVALLDTAVEGHRIVLLGELHGTREIPALVGALLERRVRRGHLAVLALEIDSHEQPRIDRFLASSGSAAARRALLAGGHWNEPHHDGRDSAAMVALIERVRRLHAAGHPVPILAFDCPGGPDRNRNMADCLRHTAAAHPAAQVLVLTGNVHAMTQRPPWTMEENGKPIEPPMTAGRYLADLHPLSIDIEAATGAFWACIAGECRPQALHPRPGASPGLTVAKSSPSAWDAELVLPRLTASPPAIAASRTRAAPPRAR